MKKIWNIFLVAILLSSCNSQQEGSTVVEVQQLKYAKGFTIETNAHYKKLSILNPWNAYKTYANYYLILDSTLPMPKSNELDFYFQNPPKSIALHTAAQAASLKALRLDDKVNGITDPRFFYEEKYSLLLDSGTLIQSSNQVQLNKERLLLLNPDIVITSGWSSITSDYQMLIKMGIPALFMIEWMEKEPLGRAEWIKALGFLFNKEKEADSIFKLVEANYNFIKSTTQNNTIKPKVLHGEEYNGVWYVAGGQSFIAQIYADAGADYLWAENKSSGSIPLDIELVIEKGAVADYWFSTFGQNAEDIKHINQEKYSVLKSVKESKIFSNINRKRAFGGNDFWETGNYRPDLILKDIVYILQNPSLNEDSLYFYKRLKLKD